MYLLFKCNLFLGYNSFFMSICYSCLETAQVEIPETVTIWKLFQDALECVCGDEINNITVEEVKTLGNKLVTLEKQFKQLLIDDDTDVLECCKSAVAFLLKAVENTHFNIKSSKEEFWSKELHAQNNGKLTSIYQTALDKTCSDASVASSFTFVITQYVIRGTILSKTWKENCGNEIEKSIRISEEEEQTLYYVAVFIVFSMKKKYEKILEENPKSIRASNALIFLKSVKHMGEENIQEQILKKFIKKWTDQINRRGLIQPNAEFYSFIKHIELVAKNLMTFQFWCKCRNEDVKNIFKEKLGVNSVVQSS